MPKKSVKTTEDAETLEHILDLQRRTKALAGDELSFFESEDMPMELREQLWERVVVSHDEVQG